MTIFFYNFFQENGNRYYEYEEIRLRRVSVDTMKGYHTDESGKNHDFRFIKLLLLDVFGVEQLKISSYGGRPSNNNQTQHAALSEDKMIFVKGLV